MDLPKHDTAIARESGQWRYWVYRVAAAVVPRIPYAISGPLAMAVGTIMWALSSGTRTRVEANLAHIPALAGDDEARATAVRGVFRHLVLNYVDLFRAHGLSETHILHEWHLEGIEHYEAARAAGRGVILISGHLGNFDHAAARLGIFGTPITIPVERLKPERLFSLVCQLRTHHGVSTVPADSRESLRALFAALRQGEAVLLAVDRDVLGTGVEVPFFGAPARLPTGAAFLARRSGAPLLWASAWREGLHHARGSFVPVALPAEELATAAEREPHGATGSHARGHERRVLAQMLGPIAGELERQIAAHPEQWMAALAPIWSDPPASAAARREEPTPAPTSVPASKEDSP